MGSFFWNIRYSERGTTIFQDDFLEITQKNLALNISPNWYFTHKLDKEKCGTSSKANDFDESTSSNGIRNSTLQIMERLIPPTLCRARIEYELSHGHFFFEYSGPPRNFRPPKSLQILRSLSTGLQGRPSRSLKFDPSFSDQTMEVKMTNFAEKDHGR